MIVFNFGTLYIFIVYGSLLHPRIFLLCLSYLALYQGSTKFRESYPVALSKLAFAYLLILFKICVDITKLKCFIPMSNDLSDYVSLLRGTRISKAETLSQISMVSHYAEEYDGSSRTKQKQSFVVDGNFVGEICTSNKHY